MKKTIARIVLYLCWWLNLLFGMFGYVWMDSLIRGDDVEDVE